MRVLYFLAFLTLLVSTVFAWEKEDHEIFDLVSEIETAEGRGTTFYSWLDVSPVASTAEIAKAYRKMSMQLHPDKNPGVKGVQERFARLGVVAAILRNRESRKRYDFFHKNGVPKWRGTGYYYSRFRPGLVIVLIFLTTLTSVLHLVVQRVNYRRDVERMDRFIREARSVAWGPKSIPVEGQRKVKVPIGISEEGPPRFLDMVVEGQNVYILDPSGDMHPLDSKSIIYPTFTNTWFFAVIKSLCRKVASPEEPLLEEQMADEVDEGSESGRSSNGTSYPPAAKAGGRRRKAAPKKR